MLYGADAGWWAYHAQDALKFAGLKVTCSDSVPQPAVHLLRNTGVDGFDPDPRCVRTGRNSAYQAVHVAVHAGARRILLCGVDMTSARGAHHFGEHPPGLRNTTEASYHAMRLAWTGLLSVLRERDIEIFNCSAASALECFPKRPIEDLLE